jgi:hypothetical protein
LLLIFTFFMFPAPVSGLRWRCIPWKFSDVGKITNALQMDFDPGHKNPGKVVVWARWKNIGPGAFLKFPQSLTFAIPDC